PVAEAWRRAEERGAYRMSSDIVQVIHPAATLENVGRSSRTERFYLEGQADLPAATLDLRLWTGSGSVLDQATAAELRVDNGGTLVRQGNGDGQEQAGTADAVAPGGDPLAYLGAVRDVTSQPPEIRAGRSISRYSFRIDGPAFAAYVRDRMQAEL